jgi:hypothetical protein
MKYNEYSHRHGKEILKILHPELAKEIHIILDTLHTLMVPRKGQPLKIT